MMHTEGQINKGLECCCSTPKNCDDCPLEMLNDCQVRLRKDSAELLFTYQAAMTRIVELVKGAKNLPTDLSFTEKYINLGKMNFADSINNIIKEEFSKL